MTSTQLFYGGDLKPLNPAVNEYNKLLWVDMGAVGG